MGVRTPAFLKEGIAHLHSLRRAKYYGKARNDRFPFYLDIAGFSRRLITILPKVTSFQRTLIRIISQPMSSRFSFPTTPAWMAPSQGAYWKRWCSGQDIRR